MRKWKTQGSLCEARPYVNVLFLYIDLLLGIYLRGNSPFLYDRNHLVGRYLRQMDLALPIYLTQVTRACDKAREKTSILVFEIKARTL